MCWMGYSHGNNRLKQHILCQCTNHMPHQKWGMLEVCLKSDAAQVSRIPVCNHAKLAASPWVKIHVAKKASSSVSPGQAFLPGQSSGLYGVSRTLFRL